MTRVKRARGLAELTSISLRAAQTKMAALAAREVGLRNNLAQIVQQHDRPQFSPATMVDAALAADANVRWQQWVDQRRRVINTELAQVMALKEQCRVELARALGRDRAARAMIGRLAKSREIKKLRRTYYES